MPWSSVYLGGAAIPPKPKTPAIQFQRSPVLGSHVFVPTSFNAQQPIRRGNTMASGLLFGGQPRPPSQGGVALADPNFEDSPLLCVHNLTYIRCVNTWRGRAFIRSAMPSHLQRCDAWFVSDS